MPFSEGVSNVQSNKSLCMCCLTQNSQLYKLNYCKHLDFFDFYKIKFDQLGKMVCYKCHSTLKKFANFKEMVVQNLKSLTENEVHQTTDLSINVANNLQIENVVEINILPYNFETEECYNFNESKYCKVVDKSDYISISNESVSKKVDNIQTALNIINRNKNFINVEPQIFEQIRDVITSSGIITNTINQSSFMKKDLYKIKKDIEISIKTHGINEDGEISAAQNEIIKDNVINDEVVLKILKKKEEIDRTEKNYNDEMENIKTIHLSIEELNAERQSQEQSIQYQKWQFKCKGCIIGFTYEENLRDHIKRKHTPNTGTIQCDICTQVYQENNRETHIARHFTRYECKKCSKRFSILDEARRHFILQHKERKYQCSLCTFKTSSMKMFTRHRARKCSETNANKKRRKNKLKLQS